MSTPDAVQTLVPQDCVAISQQASFAEHGDPLAPGACLWCGEKLRATGTHLRSLYPVLGPVARGDYGDNAFCGLRCGYLFGRRLAVLGSRLRVKQP